MQAHARAKSQARCGLNRFIRILQLKIVNGELMIVVHTVESTEDEEEEEESTEDEEEERMDAEVQNETEGGRIVRRMAL